MRERFATLRRMQPFHLGTPPGLVRDSRRELLVDTATIIRAQLPRAALGFMATLVAAWPLEQYYFAANLPGALMSPAAAGLLSIDSLLGVHLPDTYKVYLVDVMHFLVYGAFVLTAACVCALGVVLSKRTVCAPRRCVRVALLATVALILLSAVYHVIVAKYPVAWSGEPEVLAFVLVYMMVGSVVLFPWGARPQLVVTALSVLAFVGAFTLGVGSPQSIGVPLLGLILIGTLSVGTARLLEQQRLEFMRKAAELAGAYVELQRTGLQLVQADKMASLGQLVAGVAHEINNPISFIAGSVGPLRHRVEELAGCVPPAAQKQVREIEQIVDIMARGAERTAAIVQDLRSFSRLGEAARKPIDLHEGIEVSLRLLESRWREHIVIQRSYGDLPPVNCDPGQMNQVFMNLLANACDARPGNIWITTSAGDGMVTLTIRDDGCGMAPDVMAHIFDPFFTTKDVGRGTGLGLAISERVVTGHGGRIEVSSTPGAGSTFRIHLPISPPAGPEGTGMDTGAKMPAASLDTRNGRG